MSKICYISKKKEKDKYSKDNKHHKVREHCHCTCEYRGAAYSICNLKYSILKEFTITFLNASNYDYNFIITELVEEIEHQFNCLGDYRLQIIVSERFLASSLSNFANNLARGIH